MPRLYRSDIAVWLLLYRHAKPDGTVTASILDLARRTGCSKRSVRYSLNRLQSTGLIDREKRGSLSGGPSVYRLNRPGGVK